MRGAPTLRNHAKDSQDAERYATADRRSLAQGVFDRLTTRRPKTDIDLADKSTASTSTEFTKNRQWIPT
jgi:hypothetical protein